MKGNEDPDYFDSLMAFGEPAAPTARNRVDVAASMAHAPRKMQIEWFDAAATAAEDEIPDPLIEGLLDAGAMSVIYGDSNSGKTFIALDLAFHVSTGTPWNDRGVKRGLVVYVAAEGGTRIRKRLAALKKRHRPPAAPLFALVRYPIDLRSSDANLKELLALIRAAEDESGEKCVWVIVDTLSRAMAGGDENSPVDMGRIVLAADTIRHETGAHFSYVHHTGKDAARGARGHSLLRAGTDTEAEVAQGTLSATKQRDMEGGFTIGSPSATSSSAKLPTAR
jgi:RecA-family ATPase